MNYQVFLQVAGIPVSSQDSQVTSQIISQVPSQDRQVPSQITSQVPHQDRKVTSQGRQAQVKSKVGSQVKTGKS